LSSATPVQTINTANRPLIAMTVPPPNPDGPVVIHLSDEERDTGVLTPLHMFDAIDAFFVDGVVVLENAVEVKYIDALNERMVPDTEELKRNADKIHWNQGRAKGNVSQNPPLEKEYMYPQIYANKPAAAVMANIFGPRPQIRYIRTNTLIGNTADRQVVHKDCSL
jgi:hypothetical protein